MASGSGSNNRLILAVVLLIAAVGAGAYAFRTNPDEAIDPEAVFPVKCTKCGAAWNMPATQYLALAPKGTDVSGMIKCDKCGAADAVAKAKVEGKPSNPGTEQDFAKWKEESLTLDDIRKERTAAGQTGPTGSVGSTSPPKVPPKKVAD